MVNVDEKTMAASTEIHIVDLQEVPQKSLPSRPHPLDASIEDQLSRLRSSNSGASSSVSSICCTLSGIKDLYENANDLIQLPGNQWALSHEPNHDVVEVVLEGSLGLLDLCGSTLDVLSQMKQSVLELQSSLRRRSDGELALVNYLMSRKKINKMVSRCLENLQKVEKTCALEQLERNGSSVSCVRMLNEVEAVSLSTLKSVLAYALGAKATSRGRGWSLVAKLMNSKRVSFDEDANEVEKIDRTLYALEVKKSNIENRVVQNLLKQLETLEMDIKEVEDALEPVSRCLVKTRVSLLNVLNH
ncbi:hypothetical protein Ancab_007018 [Ancistrocladus abbreviatus]